MLAQKFCCLMTQYHVHNLKLSASGIDELTKKVETQNDQTTITLPCDTIEN